MIEIDPQGQPAGRAAVVVSSNAVEVSHVLLDDDATSQRQMLPAMGRGGRRRPRPHRPPGRVPGFRRCRHPDHAGGRRGRRTPVERLLNAFAAAHRGGRSHPISQFRCARDSGRTSSPASNPGNAPARILLHWQGTRGRQGSRRTCGHLLERAVSPQFLTPLPSSRVVRIPGWVISSRPFRLPITL